MSDMKVKGRMKWVVPFFWLLAVSSSLFAADGFREFRFGDSPEKVKASGQGLCSFGEIVNHTRWPWKSRLECRGYPFKDSVSAVLYFWFADDRLEKIHVVSKLIPNYFLRRYPESQYRLPLKSETADSGSVNLMDQLLFKDKVHQLADEYRYITFYYDGKWEWEYIFAQKNSAREEAKKRNRMLEEEAELGVDGWNKFKFGHTLKEVKEKLEGMCSGFTVGSESGVELLTCSDFRFLDKAIDVYFVFETSGLVKIELKLTEEWYDELLPLLKKKYGVPYLEVERNTLYYPAIEFPKANVVLAFKRENEDSVCLALKYLKEGYQDEDQPSRQKKSKRSPDGSTGSSMERILDSI